MSFLEYTMYNCLLFLPLSHTSPFNFSAFHRRKIQVKLSPFPAFLSDHQKPFGSLGLAPDTVLISIMLHKILLEAGEEFHEEGGIHHFVELSYLLSRLVKLYEDSILVGKLSKRRVS